LRFPGPASWEETARAVRDQPDQRGKRRRVAVKRRTRTRRAAGGTRPTSKDPRRAAGLRPTRMPPRPPPGNTTAPNSPATHTIGNRVSKRAKARPRTDPRPSRCRASKTRRARSRAAATWLRPRSARPVRSAPPRTPGATGGEGSAPASIHPQRNFLRQEGRDQRSEPVGPNALPESTNPNTHAGCAKRFQGESGRRTEEATTGGATPCGPGDHDAARFAALRARRSSPPAGGFARGDPKSAASATEKMSEHVRSTHGPPRVSRISAASGRPPRPRRPR